MHNRVCKGHNVTIGLTSSVASKYPLLPDTVDHIPRILRKQWINGSKCLPSKDILGAMVFNHCAVIGGAERRRHSVLRTFDLVMRVGRHSCTKKYVGARMNVQWLTEPVEKAAYYNVYIMGSMHQNIRRACHQPRSYLTHHEFKDQEAFFPLVRSRKSRSMVDRKIIYNPSLGYYALRLAAHLCNNIHIHAYDLSVFDQNAYYRRGYPRLKDHNHDFATERRVIPHMLSRCGFSQLNRSYYRRITR